MSVYKGVITKVADGLLHIELIGANPITLPIEPGFSLFDQVFVGTYKGKPTMVRNFGDTDEVKVEDPPWSNLPFEIEELDPFNEYVSRQSFSRFAAGEGEVKLPALS